MLHLGTIELYLTQMTRRSLRSRRPFAVLVPTPRRTRRAVLGTRRGKGSPPLRLRLQSPPVTNRITQTAPAARSPTCAQPLPSLETSTPECVRTTFGSERHGARTVTIRSFRGGFTTEPPHPRISSHRHQFDATSNSISFARTYSSILTPTDPLPDKPSKTGPNASLRTLDPRQGINSVLNFRTDFASAPSASC